MNELLYLTATQKAYAVIIALSVFALFTLIGVYEVRYLWKALYSRATSVLLIAFLAALLILSIV